MRLPSTYWRCCRLRCPRCGQGKLFNGLFTMPKQCAECGLVYEREPGFFLGAIYLNYGLTALVIAIGYPWATFTNTVSTRTAMIVALAFAVLFPCLFFRHARAFWLGFDQLIDPSEPKSS